MATLSDKILTVLTSEPITALEIAVVLRESTGTVQSALDILEEEDKVVRRRFNPENEQGVPWKVGYILPAP